MPSRNALIVSQLGEDEAGVVQFMLSNYLASQKVIAAVEPIVGNVCKQWNAFSWHLRLKYEANEVCLWSN